MMENKTKIDLKNKSEMCIRDSSYTSQMVRTIKYFAENC